uniref:AlNc14C419G11511 protein n=1 Tax=Albugo laibachii Nc14 TaxID=890382 RepID=F0WZA8_9STRA|nr:AlNc14C419G11511 [Albugo laibachii Nc14]|eukprot:CCA26826.1 AlNc14C419G11511 [Albugo laibachii Nc14]
MSTKNSRRSSPTNAHISFTIPISICFFQLIRTIMEAILFWSKSLTFNHDENLFNYICIDHLCCGTVHPRMVLSA